jgi:hypothetical protein
MRILTSDFFHESTRFLIHTLNYYHATVPLKSSELQKNLAVKNIYYLKLLYSQKYAENCGSEALKMRI